MQKMKIYPSRSEIELLVTYTIAFTPRQYLSHIDRNRGWPPISHTVCRQKEKKMIMIRGIVTIAIE